MEDVTRKRIVRKLAELPEEQLYQVLDYIEFLELKYAREAGQTPDAFQRFAERLEDQMRVRSLAPKAMKGTMKVVSTAGKVIDGVRTFGKDLVAAPDRTEVSVQRSEGGGSRPGGASFEAEAGPPMGAADEGAGGEGAGGATSSDENSGGGAKAG